MDGRDWSAFGGIVAGTRDQDVWRANFQQGSFVVDSIFTTAQIVTTGDNLNLTNGSMWRDPSGRISFYCKMYPKGSLSQYTATMRFFTIDANNYAEVSNTTGKVTCTVGGVAYTTATAASWSAFDLVEWYIAFGGGSLATVVEYRINGGVWTKLSTGVPPTQAAITVSGSIDVMCVGTSNQFSCVLQNITIYRAGYGPVGLV